MILEQRFFYITMAISILINLSFGIYKRYYKTGVRCPIGEALIEYGFPLGTIRRIETHFKLTAMSPGEARAFF